MVVASGKTILVVEDERIVAKDLQRSLITLGYQVPATAASADDALRLASETCPDLVLMDIRIKGELDGIETAKILRSTFDVALVYLTAYADEESVARAKVTEPHGYLLKPVKLGELRSAVEIALYKHQMERRARERERRLDLDLRSLGDAVVALDLSGHVTFMNSTAEALMGATQEHAIGKSIQDLLQQWPDSGASALAALDNQRESLAPGHPAESSAAGAFLLLRGSPGASPSVSQQRELGDRLAAIRTMARGITHEVNSPLAVVSANIEYIEQRAEACIKSLRHRAGSESAAEAGQLDDLLAAVRDVDSAAQRITLVMNELRCLSNETGESSGRTDVQRALATALRQLREKLEPNIQLVTEVEQVPLVEISESRLVQVITNLVSNAIEARDERKEFHRIELNLKLTDAGGVLLEVRDNGRGMPEEVSRRIFEPFFTSKPIGMGLGLGLSVCQGVVCAASGQIEFTTQVGVGSTFRVMLPASAASAVVDTAALRRNESPEKPTPGRILVIDDEALVRAAVQRCLERRHQVVCASSATSGLELIRRGERFDAVVCDLMMPEMTGMSFYEVLLGERPDVARRVIFITGGTLNARAEDFVRSVQNVCLEKPFKTKALLEEVQQVVNRELVLRN